MSKSPRVFTVILSRDPIDVRTVSFRAQGKPEDGCSMYNVFLGDIHLGHVSRLQRNWGGWSAVSYKDFDMLSEEQWNRMERMGNGGDRPESFRPDDHMRHVDGFHTRYLAAEFLVRHWNFQGWKDIAQ
jgi:hypothetical protein